MKIDECKMRCKVVFDTDSREEREKERIVERLREIADSMEESD